MGIFCNLYPKNDRDVVLEDGYPVCKICGRRVAAKGVNTSNMFSHIQEHHPSVKIKVIHNFYNLRPYYFCHAEGIPVCQKDAHMRLFALQNRCHVKCAI